MKRATKYDKIVRDFKTNTYSLEAVTPIEEFKFLGYEFFVTKDEDGHKVFELSTGNWVATHADKQKCIDDAKARLKKEMMELDAQIEHWRKFEKEEGLIPQQSKKP